MQHHQSVVQMLLSVDVESMGPGAHGLSELGTPDDIAMDKSIPDYSDDVDEDGPLMNTAYSPGTRGHIMASPKSWVVNADREHINESQLELDPKGESLHSIAMGKSQQWQEHDDHLRFSDDEEPEAQRGRERERDTISTQESVVDLLINGPAVGYSGGGGKSNGRENAKISLRADKVLFDGVMGVYTISLSHCKLLQCDVVGGQLTFALRRDEVNEAESSGIQKQGADQYIGTLLDNILNTEYSPKPPASKV